MHGLYMLHAVVVWLNYGWNLSQVHVALGKRIIKERCMLCTFLAFQLAFLLQNFYSII
jgi:hypothetical protein